MSISSPTTRANTLCKCGCGQPPTGRSAYHAGCFKILKRCRERFRKLRGYARWKRIPFNLTLADILQLFHGLPDVGDSFSIERIDTTKGFDRNNLLLRRHKEGSEIRRAPPDEAIQGMLAWLVERQLKLNFKDGTPPITMEEILLIYAGQQGRCAMTGDPLVVDKAVHPQSLAITRKDPDKPWTTKNTIVTGFAIKPFIDKWGANHLVTLAKRVVKHRASKKEGK